MLSKREIARYKRHLLLPEIGEHGQLALRNARVLVIGAGGLGNAVLPYLAAAGVDHLTVVDKDTVDESNLQRQVLFTESDLGEPKAETLVKKLKALNSHGNFTFCNDFFTSKNALKLAHNQDIIIDCVDQLNVRYLINDVAVHLGIPMVYGAIHKFEGQVAVFNYQNGATYRCAFPQNNELQSPPNCEQVGVVGVLPGILGMYQAMETIKIITNAGRVLSNKIMMVDLLHNAHHTIAISRKDDASKLAEASIDLIKSGSNQEMVDVNGTELTQLLLDNPGIQIIDIQESASMTHLHGKGVTHIPVAEFQTAITDLNKGEATLVYCAHGINSRWATQVLKQENFKKIYHLVGGISAI